MVSYFFLSLVFTGFCPGEKTAEDDDQGMKAEVHTAWTSQNDTVLSERYPWTSCNSTTGERCPGILDWIGHLCTQGKNQACEQKSFNVSARRVILNLRPGIHRVARWSIEDSSGFFMPDFFWFCNFSLEIAGNSTSDTTIMITDRVTTLDYSRQRRPANCTFLFDGREVPGIAAFAFHGGKISFKDLNFQPSTDAMPDTYSIIVTWDVMNLEMVRCNFKRMPLRHGAVLAAYSKDNFNHRMAIRDIEFHHVTTSNAKVLFYNIPPICVRQLITKESYDRQSALKRMLIPFAFRMQCPLKLFTHIISMSIQRCKFQTTYPGLKR